jgi:hypothetical protein
MIARRELTQVTAGTELAERLPATARQHVASARLLADSDPYLAYTHGEDRWSARVVPVTVDGLIYASSMVKLDSARRKTAVPALAL